MNSCLPGARLTGEIKYPSGMPDVLIVAGPKVALKKHIKPQADLAVDCTQLPNPFNQNNLREFDGTSREVRRWLLEQGGFRYEFTMLTDKIGSKLDKRLAVAGAPLGPPLLVSLNCMGGHHRSPAMGLSLAIWLGRHYPELDIEMRRVPYKGRMADVSYEPIQLGNLIASTQLVMRYIRPFPAMSQLAEATTLVSWVEDQTLVEARKEEFLRTQKVYNYNDMLAYGIQCPDCGAIPWTLCQFSAHNTTVFPHNNRVARALKQAQGIEPQSGEGGGDEQNIIDPFQ